MYKKSYKTSLGFISTRIVVEKGNEVKRKIIFVNEPLVFNDVTLYQTDWNILGVKLRLDDKKIAESFVPLEKLL